MQKSLSSAPIFGKGFTLVELAIALVIIALVMVLFIGASSGFISSKRYEVTALKLKAIENAIALFVAQNKRLPCPADGTIPSGAPNSGVSQPPVAGDCLNNQLNGVVPALTLGLSEADVLDGWNNRITYRVYSGVNGSLTRTDGMDMSWCDPAGTAPAPGVVGADLLCNITCSSTNLNNCTTPSQFLAGKGLRIQNAAGTLPPLMDPAGGQGAAYVLISHGDNRGGAYIDAGSLQGPVGPQVGTEEASNSNANPLRMPPANYYVDSAFNGSDTTNHFDDLMIRPSIIAVASKAQLGPRAH